MILDRMTIYLLIEEICHSMLQSTQENIKHVYKILTLTNQGTTTTC